jgi:hypothetical protein
MFSRVVAAEVNSNLAFIAPLVVTLLVALASIGGTLWSTHQTRMSERRKWLRDRQAEAYVAFLEIAHIGVEAGQVSGRQDTDQTDDFVSTP